MMATLTNEQRVERGRQAQEILEHPVLKEALDAISRNAVREWANTSAEASNVREAAWNRVRAVEAIRSEFRRIITDAAFAADAIKKAQ